MASLPRTELASTKTLGKISATEISSPSANSQGRVTLRPDGSELGDAHSFERQVYDIYPDFPQPLLWLTQRQQGVIGVSPPVWHGLVGLHQAGCRGISERCHRYLIHSH